MKLKKKKRIKDLVFQLELFSLVVLALLLYVLIGIVNGVILITPPDNAILTELNPEFEWISRYQDYSFYLAKDKNFTEVIIETNLSQSKYELPTDLDFYEYYWYVVAYDNKRVIKSSVRKFRVETLVALEIREGVKNVGNVEANVSVRTKQGDNWVNTGAAVLDVNEILRKDRERVAVYIAEQNE